MTSTRNLSLADSSVSWSSGVSLLANGVAWVGTLIGLVIILRHAFFFLSFVGHMVVFIYFVRHVVVQRWLEENCQNRVGLEV